MWMIWKWSSSSFHNGLFIFLSILYHSDWNFSFVLMLLTLTEGIFFLSFYLPKWFDQHEKKNRVFLLGNESRKKENKCGRFASDTPFLFFLLSSWQTVNTRILASFSLSLSNKTDVLRATKSKLYICCHDDLMSLLHVSITTADI